MNKLRKDDVFIIDDEIGQVRLSYPYVENEEHYFRSNKQPPVFARVDNWCEELKSYFSVLIQDEDFKLMMSKHEISDGVFTSGALDSVIGLYAIPQIKQHIKEALGDE